MGEIKGLSLESAAMPEWEENPMYRWLSEVGRAATPGNVETLWKAGKIGTRVTLLADGESTVFRATMPGQRQFEKQHDERPLDKLIVRRTPKDGAGMFIAIHEPLAEGAAPSIDSVERVGGDAATGTAVLRITRRGGIEEMVRVERSGEEPFKFTRRAGTSG